MLSRLPLGDIHCIQSLRNYLRAIKSAEDDSRSFFGTLLLFDKHILAKDVIRKIQLAETSSSLSLSLQITPTGATCYNSIFGRAAAARRRQIPEMCQDGRYIYIETIEFGGNDKQYIYPSPIIIIFFCWVFR